MLAQKAIVSHFVRDGLVLEGSREKGRVHGLLGNNVAVLVRDGQLHVAGVGHGQLAGSDSEAEGLTQPKRQASVVVHAGFAGCGGSRENVCILGTISSRARTNTRLTIGDADTGLGRVPPATQGDVRVLRTVHLHALKAVISDGHTARQIHGGGRGRGRCGGGRRCRRG